MATIKSITYSSRQEALEALRKMLLDPKRVEGDDGVTESRDLREITAALEYFDSVDDGGLAGKKRGLFQKIRPDRSID